MTGLTTLAAVAGVVLGIGVGGRFSHVGRHRLRRPAAVVLAVSAQVVATATGVGGAPAAVLVAGSYLGLVVFALANRRLLGMAPALLGLGLNIAVMVANGAMPVRESAIVAVAGDDRAVASDLPFGPKHRLEQPSDRLTVLADVVPVGPTGEVVSIGDLLLAFGVAGVVVQLMRPPSADVAPSADAPAPPS